MNSRSGNGCTDGGTTNLNVSNASAHYIEGPAVAWYLVQCERCQGERVEENLNVRAIFTIDRNWLVREASR